MSTPISSIRNPTAQALARSIDQQHGNGDGLLESGEIDAFESHYALPAWISAGLRAELIPDTRVPASPPNVDLGWVEAPAAVQGPTAEFGKSKAVLMAISDGFGPTVKLQRQLVDSLVEQGVTPYILANQALPDPSSWYPSDKVKVIRGSFESSWVRDYFPLEVTGRDGRRKFVQFEYGGPGVQDETEAAAKRLVEATGAAYHRSPLVVEGGNLMFDGKGRVFTTERVLQANPDLAKAAIEEELKAALEVDEVVWLPALYENVRGTGHIDIYAKLVNPDTVVLADTKKNNEAWKAALDRAAQEFQSRGFNVVRINNGDGPFNPFQTYTNSLLVNGVAYVPSYYHDDIRPDDLDYEANEKVRDADRAAADAYRRLGFRVVQVPSDKVLHYGGAVHCLTRELSASSPDLTAPVP